MGKFYSTTDAAKICQVTPGSVIRWIKEGKLETALTVGGHRRIPAESLFALVQKLHIPVPMELAEAVVNGHEETDLASAPKILVVDDEGSVRQMVRWALKEILPDARVEEAENGFVAGWKARDFRPDLVILDIMMPGLDGFRFCEFVRTMPELARTRILAMSGVQGFNYEEKILKLGANDFLAKPFEISALKQKIDEQIKHVQKEGNHR